MGLIPNRKGDTIVPMQTIQDTLKEAITASGLSGYELERRTGVNRLSVGRFMRGVTGLNMEQAQLLADYFGLALLPVNTKRTRKGDKH
jgi:transcriptional regulator with XRE-family HTH domain